MALTDKKYSAVHNKTGSDKARLETQFNEGHIHTFTDLADNGNPEFGALIYQIQEMQDELDYLRTEISANKDKTGISSNQASAITANTAKTGITTQQATDITDNKNEAKRLGGLVATNASNISNNATEVVRLTRGKLSMGTLPLAQPGVEQAVECGVVYDSKTKTYSMVFVYSETTPAPKGGKATTVTRTGSIQLK
jgi:hypothetical protein|tara:strand:+ start:598 stop:1185 length:588 start_codon:yes stop_codon:yes gene_type:complete